MNAAVADSLVGQTVAGRYRVTRLIGKGGMGKIYEVQHLKLRRAFAMKKLSVDLAHQPEALARFQREAEAIASLRHPNVVAVTDWETLRDGSPCIVMELLRGRDLYEHILSAGAMPWPVLARVADEVMSALSVAHRAGIVHRDLKPQNIFLAQDDAGQSQAKLLDFGVSKMQQDKMLTTQEGERLLGTPAYMSPEQATGDLHSVGQAADVWAMGAILYEMAAGRRAFEAAGTPQVLYRICHGAPDPLTQHRPDAPAAYVELIGRALSRDAAQRITAIDELRRGLREALTPIAPGAFPEPLPAFGVPPPPLLGDDEPAQVVARASLPTVVGTEMVSFPASDRARWPFITAAAVATLAVAAVSFWLLRTPDPLPVPPAPAPALVAPPPAAVVPPAPTPAPVPPVAPEAAAPVRKKHVAPKPSRPARPKPKPPGPLLP